MLLSVRGHSLSCLGWLKTEFCRLSAFFESNVSKSCSRRYSFLWASCLNLCHVLGRSCVLMSHCGHATNFVNQLVNKSMSSLVNAVCEYVIASVTGSKGANCKNTSGFFGLFVEISFQKKNSFGHQCHMSVELSWSVASSANGLDHGWIILAEFPNA